MGTNKLIFTREYPISEKLSKKLTESGLEFQELPLISLAISEALPVFNSELMNYDWIFFTSAAAVRFFYQGYGAIPETVAIAVIGTKTFEALTKEDRTRASYPPVFTSENFIDNWLIENQIPKKILFPQSQLSRQIIQEKLVKHHHQVEAFVLYHNSFLPTQQVELQNWLEQKEEAIVVFASPSAWRHFYQKYQQETFPLKFASIGSVTTGEITKAGYSVFCEAKQCTMTSLVDGIIRLKKENHND